MAGTQQCSGLQRQRARSFSVTALRSEVAFLKSADQVSGAAPLPVVIQGHGILWNTVLICVLEAGHHWSQTGGRRRGGEAEMGPLPVCSLLSTGKNLLTATFIHQRNKPSPKASTEACRLG